MDLLIFFLNLPVSQAMSSEAVNFVVEETPKEAKVKNLYFWYYATLAIHREKSAFDFQEANWKTWNQSMTRMLITMQSQNGKKKGSFPQDTLWSPYGGTFYSTAMSALCLEVYYRYQPGSQPKAHTAFNR